MTRNLGRDELPLVRGEAWPRYVVFERSADEQERIPTGDQSPALKRRRLLTYLYGLLPKPRLLEQAGTG